MDLFSSHRNGFAACEEVRRCLPSPFVYGRREPILCPKPLRVFASPHGESFDSADIIDMLLTKDNHESLDQLQLELPVESPPYFCGSPPVRAGNPLIHDPGFLQGKHYNQLTQPTTKTTTLPVERANNTTTTNNTNPLTSTGMVTSAGARSCSSKSFGPKPAAVRIEGFNCLNRGSRGCSISAFA